MKKRVLSLILILVMAVSMLAACEQTEEQVEVKAAPLVVGYTSFNGNFSPFYASTDADKDAVAMTQVNLLTLDREGSVIDKAIKGETVSYNGTEYTYYGISDVKVKAQGNGTVTYDFTIRDDVKFSDGDALTADDVIFTMYVLCDPTYNGPYNLGKAPILGLEEYHASMKTLLEAYLEAGRDNTDFTYWEQSAQEAFWQDLEQAGTQFAQEIVDYLEETSGTESIQQAAKLWGYEGLSEQTSATEFFYMMCEAYEWDLNTLNNNEKVSKSFFSYLENYNEYKKGVQLDLEVANITGIEKTGDYSVRVTMTENNVANIHYLDIPVAPMHYYGNPSLYQYENNSFGLVKGDLSLIASDAQHPNKGEIPMGAGPYQMVVNDEEEDNTAINYVPNPYYYLGVAKTESVQFVEISSARKINGIVNGAIDLTDVSLTKKVANNIANANPVVPETEVLDETAGVDVTEVVKLMSYDDPSYGYIGINAERVSVKEDADSRASKNLRKAFATVFSAFREEFIGIYFDGNASVVDYPVSNASWAAPEKGGKSYKTAYATDVNGKAIYKDNMTYEEKYAAAKEAALAYFKAAGYTVEDGVVVAAPRDTAMQFELMVVGNSLGEHPAYMTILHAKEVFAELGINLVIKDVTDEAELWTALENGTCDMWVAAWETNTEPDIYEMYHSDGVYNYMYGIKDNTLDYNLEAARTTLKQSSRASLYKKCYDSVLDWAVEVPVYQKEKGIINSPDRINADTMMSDVTGYYGWINEIHTIEMYDIVVTVE